MISASDIAKRFRDAAVAGADVPDDQAIFLVVVVATADPGEHKNTFTNVSIATTNNRQIHPSSADVRAILDGAIELTHEHEPTDSRTS